MITEATGSSSMDRFLEESPAGRVMLTATEFGKVFLAAADIDDDLELIARSDTTLLRAPGRHVPHES
jgi:hypothetical protein